MNEKMIKNKNVYLCTESFGNPNNPAILLIMGATASMIWWDEQFCKQLAEAGHYVIRFDNRDVGRSTTYEPGTLNYTVRDMAEDAIGVLHAYHIEQAHIVGMSLGGMIAQVIALTHPQMVLSLTLLMTSIFATDNHDHHDLPPIDEKIIAHHTKGATINWSDKEATVQYLADGWTLLSGSRYPFDKQRAYDLARLEVNRAENLPSMFNHGLLQEDTSFTGKLSDIAVPTLVIHGTDDPVLPTEHGIALAKGIPQSTLTMLEGVGHEIPPDEWESIIRTITKQTLSHG
ncbi:alpha/beta fold hydrolase [Marininema halotolerans]|uniref:Pimeloyl-ACP methyl ester carboxylesterase n=1 Tax=Marininema halotolerans TaxID=1155944 RepID=A0A1I6PRC4_9BACL|nr:alpha/beta hydrolase [Marininema halotolerans]SFS42769.1 Pimeloyl-ACP methyl ester carboxylesterase [Marininema halotolerans]